MALSMVMAVTNSDIKSMNVIKSRLKLTEALQIKIPNQEYQDCENRNGFEQFSPPLNTSTPKLSPTDSDNSENSKSNSIESSKENKEVIQNYSTLRITYNNRDILNLGANLREPSWHRWNPRSPHYNTEDDIPISNYSVHYRLDKRNYYKQDFPVKYCRSCEFAIPLPNIYR